MAFKTEFNSLIDNTLTVNIASSQQLSDTIDAEGMTLVGIRLPATLTGATFSIQESDNLAGTYRDVYNTNGSLFSFTVAANRTVLFNPSDLAGLRFIKLKSAATEAAQRTITCILRAI